MMESSFFEYRDATGAADESDVEIINDSFSEDHSLSSKKKYGYKNQTVFIAESEESPSEDDSADDEDRASPTKAVARRSSAAATAVVSSSDDDSKNRARIRSQSGCRSKVVSSSSEDEMSPEIVPRYRPNFKRNRKRIMLIDSDTENSIVIDHNKNRKHTCLKETPVKVVKNISDSNINGRNDSIPLDHSNSYDEMDDEGKENNKDSDESISKNANGSSDGDVKSERTKVVNCTVEDNSNVSDGSYGECSRNKSDASLNSEQDDDDEVDEDQMVMSRATRMSIMGFVPKETPSDDSDIIQSDCDSSPRPESPNGFTEMLDTSVTLRTPQLVGGDGQGDVSTLSCSPFTSPLKNNTNEFNDSCATNDKSSNEEVSGDVSERQGGRPVEISDLTGAKRDSLRNKVLQRLAEADKCFNQNVIDDDLTIIDTKPEVITLSSDEDDDYVKVEKKSPAVKKMLNKKEESQKVDMDMKQYLLPPSYPGRVVYVKKHVRENELRKLEGLQVDLQSIRSLMENTDSSILPDGGVKLSKRLSSLEQEVRRQQEKVAEMVVEPDDPSAKDIAKDGFKQEENKGLTWEDIQKGSNNVQPRMFGKQAMATHMAERNLILERLRDLHESLASRPPEHELAKPPAALKTELMPHQQHALAWLRWRETQRPPGGILADDMGLGKTITMIALIASDKENDAADEEERADQGRLIRGGTLVVCPASLMQQWAEEVQRHCLPHRLSVCQHHGAARALQPHRLAAHDLVLTTYNILLREAEKQGALCRVQWRRAILDEAHAVRNHKSATAGAVLPGRLRARRRWALTGTPLHNRDLDLFALLRFLGCSPFDDLTMWKKWIDNKSLGGQERLSTIMQCIMLRRTKQQLQERGQLSCLPQRDVHELQVVLTRNEMNVYQKLLVLSKTLFAQFLHQRAEKRADAIGFQSAGKDTAYAEMHRKMVKLQGAKPVKSHEILVLLLRLRQVCCHCGLIAAMLSDEDVPVGELEAPAPEDDLLDELKKLELEDKKTKRKDSRGDGKKDDKEEEGEGEEGSSAAEALRSVLARNNPVFALDTLSSKIKAVMDCLQKKVFLNAGEKAVVVSQWTGVLRLVERELVRARVQCVTLSGAVAVAARAPLVAALNDPGSPVRVMLLSLTAGGVGLNLCGANHLLLLDPHWNPQLEQQAQDRVYRVGQSRAVHIYRFMCVDTVEQSIRQLQRVKLELADSVLTGARHTNASKLSIEDLKMLFNMAPQ